MSGKIETRDGHQYTSGMLVFFVDDDDRIRNGYAQMWNEEFVSITTRSLDSYIVAHSEVGGGPECLHDIAKPTTGRSEYAGPDSTQ